MQLDLSKLQGHASRVYATSMVQNVCVCVRERERESVCVCVHRYARGDRFTRFTLRAHRCRVPILLRLRLIHRYVILFSSTR